MEEIKKVEEVTESPVTNVEAQPSSPIVEAKTSYEQQAMTRRQALGRLGFLAGAAAVAALGVDDLTRLVGKEMQKRAGDDKTARKVAQEFANAGVAFATPSGIAWPCSGCLIGCWANNVDEECQSCGGWCLGTARIVPIDCATRAPSACWSCCNAKKTKCYVSGKPSSTCNDNYTLCLSLCDPL
jgi:hypothetical protein